MDTDALDHLPLIEEGDVAGYALEDVERALGPDLAATFGEWMHGQTGVILQGRLCVYPWDLARFIRRERRAPAALDDNPHLPPDAPEREAP